ncbi:hypothetical protein [Stratiformator vulcanicus]|nr:hypothetical protein [Stratiformator vulcanicus]
MASAQAISVQQPTFGIASVNTTVSVPDRGEAYLGGLKSARDSTGSSLPNGFGSRISRTRSSTAITVRPFIHDLHEMDRMILEDARHGTNHMSAYTKSAYDDPTSYAMSRRFRSGGVIAEGREREAADIKLADRSRARRDSGSKRDAARFIALGRKAAENGRVELARLHYRTAEELGAPEARQMLAELTAPSVASHD